MSRTRPIPQLVVRAHDPRRRWRVAGVLLVLWAGSLLLAWHLAGGRIGDGSERALRDRIGELEGTVREHEATIADMKDQLAVSKRADQVSRTANDDLQRSLRDSEEEIAGLRADLAFYQRLVGGSAERRGLTVHDLRLQPIGSSGGYAYALTLTQNLKKGAVSEGDIALEVEGVRDQRVTRLPWSELARDQGPASALKFKFKYFQRLEGSFMLPAGFTPNRLKVRAQSRSGETTERTFTWDDALAQAENDHVRQ